MDSGMANGSSGDDLERLSNFYTGAEENPTSAQSAPKSRAGRNLIGIATPDSDPIFTPTLFLPEQGDGDLPLQPQWLSFASTRGPSANIMNWKRRSKARPSVILYQLACAC
jgi:hypothetical protein